MSEIEQALREHWPPRRVIVTCKECDKELFDTAKDDVRAQVPLVSATIETYTKHHLDRTGHASIDVGIETEPKRVQEIDATITVNGK